MSFLWIFLPISLILYFFADNKYKNLILVLASLLFYAWGQTSAFYLLILLILINYLFGFLITKKYKNKKYSKYLLILGIIINLLPLIYFKYSNFIILNINRLLHTNLNLLKLTLPIGISFFIFSNISYLIDIYRKDAKLEKNIINFALYVSFFPKLTMGPIEQYKNFSKQIKTRKMTIDSFYEGIISFGYGIFKKVFISNTLAITVDIIFKANIGSITQFYAWIGAICYMLQIYYDFSGYSDMAIGLGKMFGYDLSKNFDYPYLSSSITEFWRKWHITLNKWFLSYIYIPLGGNRNGLKRTIINILIVFAITGLWHGSSWNFIIWGLFNGLLVVTERLGLIKKLNSNKILGHIYTIFMTLIGWVLFRSEGIKNAIIFLKKMFIPSNIDNYSRLDIYQIMSNKTIFVIICGILFCGFIQYLFKNSNKLSAIYIKYKEYLEPLVVILFIIISIFSIVSESYNSFIYNQF